jgi:hypothetical protein
MSNFKINHSLLFRLSDFSRVRTQLTEDNERLEKTLLMEREQRIQTEEVRLRLTFVFRLNHKQTFSLGER